jgi:hypothetical protein
MKRLLAGLCGLTLMLLVSPYVSPHTKVLAQASAVETKTAGSSSYDVSREVTFAGTVASVLAKPSAGMLSGSHLLLATVNGRLDASLGRFGLRGEGAPTVTAGQQVEVTGMMKTIKGKPVLWTRMVKIDGQTYAIRTEHGFPVSPQSRKRMNPKMTGGAL